MEKKLNQKKISRNFTFVTLMFIFLFASSFKSLNIKNFFSFNNNENKSLVSNEGEVEELDLTSNDWINAYDFFGYEASEVNSGIYGPLTYNPGIIDDYNLKSDAKLVPIYSTGNWSNEKWNGISKTKDGASIYGEIVHDSGLNYQNGRDDKLGLYETNDTDRSIGYNLSTFEDRSINSYSGVTNDGYSGVYRLYLPDYVEYIDNVEVSFTVFDQNYNAFIAGYDKTGYKNIYINGFYNETQFNEKSNRDDYTSQYFRVVPRYFDRNLDGFYSSGDLIYAIDLEVKWDVNGIQGYEYEEMRNYDVLLAKSIDFRFTGVDYVENDLLNFNLTPRSNSAKLKFQGNIFGRSYADNFKLVVKDSSYNEIGQENIIIDGNGNVTLNNLESDSSYIFEVYSLINPLNPDIDNDGNYDYEILDVVGSNTFETLSSGKDNFILEGYTNYMSTTENSGIVEYDIDKNIFSSNYSVDYDYFFERIQYVDGTPQKSIIPIEDILEFLDNPILPISYLESNEDYFINFGYDDLGSGKPTTYLSKNVLLHTNYTNLDDNLNQDFIDSSMVDESLTTANSLNFNLSISDFDGRDFYSIQDIFVDLSESVSFETYVTLNSENTNYSEGKFSININNLNSNSSFISFDMNIRKNKYDDSLIEEISIINFLFYSESWTWKTDFIKPKIENYVIKKNEEGKFQNGDSILFKFSDVGSFENVNALIDNSYFMINGNRYNLEDPLYFWTFEQSENSVEITFFAADNIIFDDINASGGIIELWLPFEQIGITDYNHEKILEINVLAPTKVENFVINYDEFENFLEINFEISLGSWVNLDKFYLEYVNLFTDEIKKYDFKYGDNDEVFQKEVIFNSDSSKIVAKYYIYNIPSASSFKIIGYGFSNWSYSEENGFLINSNYLSPIINYEKSNISKVGKDYFEFSIEVEDFNDFNFSQMLVVSDFGNIYSFSNKKLYLEEKIGDRYYFCVKNLESNTNYGRVRIFIPTGIKNGNYIYSDYFFIGEVITKDSLFDNLSFYLLLLIFSLTIIFSIFLTNFFTKRRVIEEQNLKIWTYSILDEKNNLSNKDLFLKDDFEDFFNKENKDNEEITDIEIEE